MNLLCLHIKSIRIPRRTNPSDSFLSVFVWLSLSALLSLTSGLYSALPHAFAANQDPSSVIQNKTPSEIDLSSTELKIKEVKKRLADAEAEENELKANQLGITLSQLQDRSLKLQDLETVYQSLIADLISKKNKLWE